MNYLKTNYLILVFFISTSLFSQKKWKIDNKISKNATAAVYIPGMDMAAFISGTNITYLPINEGEKVTTSLTDYGSLPEGWNNITAAVKWDNSNIMLFNGITYLMLDITGPTLTPMGDFPGLPKTWGNKLDAAVEWGESQILFFSGNEFIIFSKEEGTISEISKISDWQGLNPSWEKTNSVLNINDGYLYFFNKNKYVKLNTETQEFDESISKSSFGLPPAIKKASLVTKKEEEEEILIEDINTDNWCLTGTPSGASDADLVEDVTKSKGGKSGDSFEDTIPQGTRVKEIKIWGGYVLVGLQVVLQTSEGKTIELPILGSKKGKTKVFAVPEGDCITGITGTFAGSYGNFIHGISFKTSSKKSKYFGSRGKKHFKIDVPSGASFYGFKVSAKNYISNIALKYVAYEGSIEEEEIVVENNATDNTNPGDKYKGAYDDSFTDVKEAAMSEDSMTSFEVLPAVEWLGKGVNILNLDPLDIGGSETKESPIILITSKKMGGPQGRKNIPYGTDYKTVGSGRSSTSKSWVEKFGDFTTNFGIGVSVEVGTPVGGGSLSGSYKQMNKTSLGSEEIYLTQFIDRTLFNLNLDLKWTDRSFKKYRQLLSPDFREKIDALPVVSSYPKLSHKNMSKKRKLPSQILKVRDAYMQMIEEYGTHIIGNVDFGGKFVTSTKISKSTYQTTRMTAKDFKAHAEGQIKMVTVGGSAEFNYGTKNVSSEKSGNVATQHYIQGSNGETVFNTWSANLKESAVPIKVKLLPLYLLLSKIYWPKDKDIEKKRDILKIITEKYQINNGIKPKKSKGGFFSLPKALKHKYTLTIKSINCKGIDSREAGSANEIFGLIHSKYTQPNKKTTYETEWKKNEGGAVSIYMDQSFPLGKKHSVTLKEGDIKGGNFRIYANFKEADDAPNDDDILGDRKIVDYPLSKFTSEPKDYEIKGFIKDGDILTLTVTLQKERIIQFD